MTHNAGKSQSIEIDLEITEEMELTENGVKKNDVEKWC